MRHVPRRHILRRRIDSDYTTVGYLMARGRRCRRHLWNDADWRWQLTLLLLVRLQAIRFKLRVTLACRGTAISRQSTPLLAPRTVAANLTDIFAKAWQLSALLFCRSEQMQFAQYTEFVPLHFQTATGATKKRPHEWVSEWVSKSIYTQLYQQDEETLVRRMYRFIRRTLNLFALLVQQ